MHHLGSSDPPRTLAERLARLNDHLQALGDRLKASIASIVGGAIADAVSEAIRRLLGGLEPCTDPYRDRHGPTTYRDRADDTWGEKDRRWEDDEDSSPARGTPAPPRPASSRWGDALRAAAQAALWFLRQQPRRRPVLTAFAVTVAAGVTGFVAGPTLAVGASVLASVASLLLTIDGSRAMARIATS
ncbi:MAG: hypothetical protein U0840_29945 [Gemmataceae bacterium]